MAICVASGGSKAAVGSRGMLQGQLHDAYGWRYRQSLLALMVATCRCCSEHSCVALDSSLKVGQ